MVDFLDLALAAVNMVLYYAFYRLGKHQGYLNGRAAMYRQVLEAVDDFNRRQSSKMN